MKLWFRLTIVCGALLGLLLGLTPPADWNYQSHVVRSGPCFDQGKETAPDSSTASLVASMECDPARAASLESLVLDRALTVSNTGPPGQETHGPAELMVALGELPLKPATQTNAIQQPSPQIYWLSTAELKIGVPQQALASRRAKAWSTNSMEGSFLVWEKMERAEARGRLYPSPSQRI